MFDIFNSKSKFGGTYKFKSPIDSKTEDDIFKYLDFSMNYLQNLKVSQNGEEKLIVNCKAKTDFVGFIVAAVNFKLIYQDFVIEKRLLQYILTFKYSQDHIETFFSAIRIRGGWNNNPTCSQFSAAYKKLLVHTEIKASQNANSLDIGSQSILCKTSDNNDFSTQASSFLNNHSKEIAPDAAIRLKAISPIVHDAVVYIAGYVEKTLLTKIKKCDICAVNFSALNVHDNLNLITCKDWGGLIKPKKDVVNICAVAEENFSLADFEKEFVL